MYVDDPTILTTLNSELISRLRSQTVNEIFLGCPEIIDDEAIGGFQIKGLGDRNQAKNLLFPSINQYLKQLDDKGKLAALDLSALESHKIVALDRQATPAIHDHWSIYRCLNAEIVEKNKIYKLMDNNWYEVDPNFLNEIDKTIANIPDCQIATPNLKPGDSEGVYNKQLAAALKGICFDAQLVTLKGRTPFEFCDVFDRSKRIIHVKKYTGASSMSHLLYQAFVSGQLYTHYPATRAEIENHKLVKPTSFGPALNPKTFNASNYEIVFAIATPKKKAIRSQLSFFSKLSLAHKFRILRGFGYQVSIKHVLIA